MSIQPINNKPKPVPAWYDRESLLLASFATHSRDSAGRRFEEADHAYRGPYQRDRDRILHSAAFRRLSGKMQVFTGDMGDYHRTRLTHTQEVASIARTIGRHLRLNEDLIEALALLHDVGHPPYGHCGEDALNRCMENHGGFSHNRFALQLIEQIETRYTQTPGLNLTYEVLAGQQHRTDKGPYGPVPSLEVQIVDAADSIAYDAHDVDDALKLGLLQLDQLLSIAFIQRAVAEQDKRREQTVPTRQFLVHAMIETQVDYFLRTAQPLLESCNGQTADRLKSDGIRLMMPTHIEQERGELEAFLFANVYRHPRLVIVREQAAMRLQQLFRLLVAYPERLPDRFLELSQRLGVEQSVAVYLGGMTDRFCDETYLQLVEMGRNKGETW